MKLAGKMTSVVISILLLVGITIAGIGYSAAYNQIKVSAGLELIGCANITSGLVSPSDIQDLAKGNRSKVAKVENQINWIVAHKPIFKNVSIMTTSGKLLAVDNALKQQGFKAGDSFYVDKKIMSEIISMKHPEYTDVYQFGGLHRQTGYAPIFKNGDPKQDILAIMAIDFDASILTQRTNDIMLYPLMAGSIVTIIAVIALFVLIRKMVKPVVRITEHVNVISNGDLTVDPLLLKGKDEVVQLANNMNAMITNLRNLVGQIMKSSELAAATSQQLSASAEVTRESSLQIANSIHNVAEGATKQADQSHLIVTMMEEAVTEIDKGHLQAGNSSQSAIDATHAARQGEKSIQDTITHLNFVSESVTVATDSIQKLGRRSDEISGIIRVIQDISSHTNLLALNAAIEAARAGEQGRGFAVVAEQVRKLAVETSTATEQIRELIQDIQSEISITVEAMESSFHAVKDQTEIMHMGVSALQVIVDKAEDTENSVRKITETFDFVRQTIEEVLQQVHQMSNISEQSAAASEQVAATTVEQQASVRNISIASTELAKLAERLQDEVNEFKL